MNLPNHLIRKKAGKFGWLIRRKVPKRVEWFKLILFWHFRSKNYAVNTRTFNILDKSLRPIWTQKAQKSVMLWKKSCLRCLSKYIFLRWKVGHQVCSKNVWLHYYRYFQNIIEHLFGDTSFRAAVRNATPTPMTPSYCIAHNRGGFVVKLFHVLVDYYHSNIQTKKILIRTYYQDFYRPQPSPSI